MGKAKTPSDRKLIATNRRARHDYEILDVYEAGLVLVGSEVKSLRAGHANIGDAFAMIRDGEAFLIGATIAPYAFSRLGGHEPDRPRKLLLHGREIDRLRSEVAEKGLTLVPLSLYFRDGRVKVEIGVGRGRRAFDKRHALRDREQQREIDRAVRRRR